MCVFILRALYTTKLCFYLPIATLTVIITLVWTVSFFVDQKRVSKNPEATIKIDYNFGFALVLAFFLSFYFSYVIWGSGYLSLFPLEMIDNGKQHLDTLFHSSIAESYKRSIVASTLLNNESYLPYHTFSHFLLGNISKIIGIPALYAYNFIYPILCIPFYITSQFVAIAVSKWFFTRKAKIGFIDSIIVVIFNVGIPFDNQYGVWNTSKIVSESFMIANTIAFISYAVLLIFLKKKKRQLDVIILCLIVIPIQIFIISWSKISVGLLFCLSVMYYIFRTKMGDLRFWLLNIMYCIILYVSLLLFQGSVGGGSDSLSSGLVLFAYKDYCKGILGIWGHFLICTIWALFFIFMDYRRKKYTKDDFLHGKTVWIELLILIGIVSLLPASLLRIPGGSAAYFSLACSVISICILGGQDFFETYDKILKNRSVWSGILVCICVWIILGNTPVIRPTHVIALEHQTNTSGLLLEIRNYVGNHPEQYTIYLDDDAFTTGLFEQELSSVYVCPALTGVGVINATYKKGNECFSFEGEKYDSTYGVSFTDNDHKISFDEAKSKAKKNGKKGIIHITNTGYEIINL